MAYSHGVLKAVPSPNFLRLRTQLGPYLVDKTELIEKIVDNGLNGSVDLVLRPRHCGKTTMLSMLRSFFSIPRREDSSSPKELFKGLHVESRPDICEEHMGQYAIIFCSFKHIAGSSWDEMLSLFRELFADIYKEWYPDLRGLLDPEEDAYFESIRLNTASVAQCMSSLMRLSVFLARRFGQRVMVFIDDYDVPINQAYTNNFFNEADEFLRRGVLSALLKDNIHIEYAVLTGVTPVAKTGWYSGLSNIEMHALHVPKSIFAGMVMFTESDVLQLRNKSNCSMEMEALRAHYGSYLAGGHIDMYCPVSIMHALNQSTIDNYWVATGQFPLSKEIFPGDTRTLYIVESLLSGFDVPLQLDGSIAFNISSSFINEALTLVYFAGYLTETPTGRFKIPNREVMADWARWATGREESSYTDILDICVRGPVSAFEERWPDFLQQSLHPKMASQVPSAASLKTAEKIFQVYMRGLLSSLKPKGWEVAMESRAGAGYIDIRLVSKVKKTAVLIELKLSKMLEHMEEGARNALQQIILNNYREKVSIPGILYLREYGIASFHLASHVEGRYLELVSNQWQKSEDPANI